MSKTLIVEDQTFKYQIWDTAGQEKYRGLAPMYYRNAAAAIIVYEITRKQSFEALKHWVKELRQFGPSNIILAIAGNKSDLESQRQVSSDEAKEYADSIDALFVETSALTADNVSYLFEALSKRLPQESIAQPKPASTVQLVDETPNKPKNEKCGAC
ncbi:Rab31 protein, variant [Capsaspora owczarzaki ATCC 30864]|nr:Rab31 protein, variant [Capsaspora owczarzaki ATCC 30864]